MELADIDIEALTSRVLARMGPSDLDPELQKTGVRIGMAVALETVVPAASASRRRAMEAAILDPERGYGSGHSRHRPRIRSVGKLRCR